MLDNYYYNSTHLFKIPTTMINIIRKKIRKQINRSGKQRCEICNEISILITHHINGRNIPDAEKWWNKANICDKCHRLIHEGEIIISEWASTTNGRELLWHYKNEKSITEKDATPYLIPNQTR